VVDQDATTLLFETQRSLSANSKETEETNMPDNRRVDVTSSARTTHAVWTAFIGFFIDIYDIYLPIIILAPAYIYFRPADLKSPLLDSFIFATALIGRPAGALFFGYFADRLGRKRAASTTMSGAALCVFLTGLLPGYQTIGIYSIVLLIVLRFMTGFFAGGQYTGAVTLAMETCPKKHRGFYGALIGSSSNLSFVVMALFGLVLLRFLPAAHLDDPYIQWGWRIPFFVGTVITVAFLLYMRGYVQESESWLRTRSQTSPFKMLFGNMKVGTDLFQGFLLMSGLWLAYFAPAAMMPALLRSAIGLTALQMTLVMLIASVVCFVGFLAGGLISDRIGRRSAFIWLGIATAVVGAGILRLLFDLPKDEFRLICVYASIVFGVVGLVWGSGPHAYLNERFHTGNRSSGYGIAFSFAIILPSFFSLYQQWLGAVVPATDTPSILLVIGAIIVVLAAAWGPETSEGSALDDEAGIGVTAATHQR
jgi:MFS family permease